MASTEPYKALCFNIMALFTAYLLALYFKQQHDNQLLKAENKRLLDIITKMDASLDTKHRPSPYAYPKELRNNVKYKTNEGTYYMKYDKKYTRIYKSDVGYFYLEGWDVKHTNTIMADSINKLVKSIRNVKSVNAWTLIYDTNL